MSIEERLRRLEDEKAILDTLHAYGHHLDYGLEDAWIDCWTEDAVLDWPGRAFMRGHAELRVGFRAHSHAPGMYHKPSALTTPGCMPGSSASWRVIRLSVVGASMLTHSPSAMPSSPAVSGAISSTGQGLRLRSLGISMPRVE